MDSTLLASEHAKGNHLFKTQPVRQSKQCSHFFFLDAENSLRFIKRKKGASFWGATTSSCFSTLCTIALTPHHNVEATGNILIFAIENVNAPSISLFCSKHRAGLWLDLELVHWYSACGCHGHSSLVVTSSISEKKECRTKG